MQLLINGEPRDIAGNATVQDLIQLLELKNDRVAVELNRQIVRRERWSETQLRDQDRLEIVHFVGGG